MPGATLFPTALGPCGLAWSERGLTHVVLPHASEGATRARLGRLCPDATDDGAPAWLTDAIVAIRRLLEGEPVDLAGIPVDLDGVPDFERQVYAVARTIRPGRTLTYGEVADSLGSRDLARAVGAALGRNPCPIVVPCHRVLAADGTMHGFSAPGGIATKARLLEIEGALRAPAGLFADLPVMTRPPRPSRSRRAV